MNNSILFCLIFTLVLPFLTSCKGGNSRVTAEGEAGDTLEMKYARNLTIVRHPGYTTATLRNPWDSTKTLHRYILVGDSIDLPDNLPAGTVVRTPLKNSLVYSTIHHTLIGELGATEAIGGICDAQYIHDPAILSRIAEGKITDCGNNNSPNIERIIQLNPDAILLSPYENSGSYGKLGQTGIPLVECADYMESSPLSRTEWMKFYGLLFGCEKEAEKIFSETENDYLALKMMTDTVSFRPKVIVDRLYGNSWYVPAANSTMGTYIRDAGGSNPFDRLGNNGSVGLSGEQVLHEAGDADIWLVRYTQSTDKTLRELAADNAIYPMFKALKEGKVYGCNTQKINFYEDTPYHPHWLLRELIAIFHPELAAGLTEPIYFTPLQP